MFMSAARAALDGPLRGGPAARRRSLGAAGVRSHGVNAADRLRRDLVPAGPRPRPAGRDRARDRAHGRRQPAPAHVADRAGCAGSIEADRLDDARRLLGRRSSSRTVALIGDNQMFLPQACTLVEVAEALDDAERCAVLQATLDAVCRAGGGERSGRVLGRAGQRVRRRWPHSAPATSPLPSGTCARRSTRTSPTGPCPTRPGRAVTWPECSRRWPRGRRRRGGERGAARPAASPTTSALADRAVVDRPRSLRRLRSLGWVGHGRPDRHARADGAERDGSA